jgi:hypothetical protein
MPSSEKVRRKEGKKEKRRGEKRKEKDFNSYNKI